VGTSAFRKNDAERVREHLYAFGQSVLHTEMQRLLGRAAEWCFVLRINV